MKHSTFMLSIGIVIFFTSCFDIIHYIEPRNDKTLFIQFRLTAYMLKDDKSQDTVFQTELKEKIKDYPKSSVTCKPFSNELKGGFEFTAIINKAYINKYPEEEFPIVPYKDKLNQYIFMYRNKENFRSYKNEYSDIASGLTDALLSSANYKMIFPHSFIPKSATLILYNGSPQIMPLTLFKVGQQYYIDIPILAVLTNFSAIIISTGSKTNNDEILSKLKELYAKSELQQKQEKEMRQQQEEKQYDNEQQDEQKELQDNYDNSHQNDTNESENNNNNSNENDEDDKIE